MEDSPKQQVISPSTITEQLPDEVVQPQPVPIIPASRPSVIFQPWNLQSPSTTQPHFGTTPLVSDQPEQHTTNIDRPSCVQPTENNPVPVITTTVVPLHGAAQPTPHGTPDLHNQPTVCPDQHSTNSPPVSNLSTSSTNHSHALHGNLPKVLSEGASNRANEAVGKEGTPGRGNNEPGDSQQEAILESLPPPGMLDVKVEMDSSDLVEIKVSEIVETTKTASDNQDEVLDNSFDVSKDSQLKFCECSDDQSSDNKDIKEEGKIEQYEKALEMQENVPTISMGKSVDVHAQESTNITTNQSCPTMSSTIPPTDISNNPDDSEKSVIKIAEASQEGNMASGSECHVEKQVPVFLCDENSKDQPPQNFKPFSHYNTEGKLMEEESCNYKVDSPFTTEDRSLPESDIASSSVLASSEPPSRVNTPSKFQGQFMHFLKGSDDATEHSMDVEDSQKMRDDSVSGFIPPDESSQTPSEKGRRSRKQKKGPASVVDENSQSMTQDGSKSGKKKKTNPDTDDLGKVEVLDEENAFPPEKLFEYQWPQSDKNSDWFFLQEQVSAYLHVKSFKRKFPEFERRPVVMAERNFLAENGVVSEMQCDLGLTALKSDQVYALMSKEYPTKYQAYAEILHAREKERQTEKNKAQAEMAKMDKKDINDLVKKAVKSAAEFNAQLLREKREERRAYFDLQTYEVHYPQSQIKKLPPDCTKVSSYPVALIPGQYQDYYKKYSSQQLRYFPVHTAIYDPPRHLKTIYADPSDKYESELDSQSASSQGEEDGSSSSGSSSGSSSESGSDSDDENKDAKPAPQSAKKIAKTNKGNKKPTTKADANAVCTNCLGNAESNKEGQAEELVKCSECGRHGHPSCLELTEEMIPNIKTYPWQCMECKTCVECTDPYDEDKMMFCDHCDRGYHTFCVGLRGIPTGRWECPSCRPEPPNKRRRR